MTILQRLEAELATNAGPIRSNEMASRLGVPESTLESAMALLASMGRLNSTAAAESVACTSTPCGSTCAGPNDCAFIVQVPDSYELVIKSVA